MSGYFRPRRGRAALVAGAVLALTACDSLLEVDNPSAIEDDDLNTSQLATVLANSAKGAFQAAFDDLTYYSAIISDEAVTGHNFVTWQEVDLRRQDPANGTMTDHYELIHAARYLADTTAVRLQNILDDGDQDYRTAVALTFAGYSYVFAGEILCESPINAGETIFTAAELTGMAVPRFQQALSILNGSPKNGTATEVSQLRNLAYVGLARTQLQLGNGSAAKAAAEQVDDGFTWWVRYSENSGRETNLYRGATQGANRNLGVDVTYRFLNDPRVVHTPTSGRGHNNLTLLWDPYQPESFDGWVSGQNVLFDRNTGIRLASALEARYVIAEVDGPTAATLAFVNERREVGTQEPVELTGEALMAELRDQRRRDFFLDGHRLGDLRRYKSQGVGDFFPTGDHPNSPQWAGYGTDTCLILPLSERIGNPNI